MRARTWTEVDHAQHLRLLRTGDVEHHDLASETRVVERDEEARAGMVDTEKLRPDDGHVGEGEDRKVEHRGRGALCGVKQVELVVVHARREGAVVAIVWDELDIDRAGRMTRITDGDRTRDRALRQIPHTDAA